MPVKKPKNDWKRAYEVIHEKWETAEAERNRVSTSYDEVRKDRDHWKARAEKFASLFVRFQEMIDTFELGSLREKFGLAAALDEYRERHNCGPGADGLGYPSTSPRTLDGLFR